MRNILGILLMISSLCCYVICEGSGGGGGNTLEGTYLGISGYGSKKVTKENIEDFMYLFDINGKTMAFSVDNSAVSHDGLKAYPIQNLLKEGCRYLITVEDDMIVKVTEQAPENNGGKPYTTPVSGTPGELTLRNFITTAFMPVGTALYIYGGGWDWQDEGSSVQCRSIGISDDWVRFFETQNDTFSYKKYYPDGGFNEYYYAGLDCSGYVGWCVYNTLETENGKDGYVSASTGLAKKFSKMGLGSWTNDFTRPDGKNGAVIAPGSIMSINGHVWISLGTCKDGSVAILHSSPTDSRTGHSGGGVQMSAIGKSRDCEALKLADHVMKTYYPAWYERYGVALMSPDVYYKISGDTAGLFTWDLSGKNGTLSDPDGISGMTPEELIKLIFNE